MHWRKYVRVVIWLIKIPDKNITWRLPETKIKHEISGRDYSLDRLIFELLMRLKISKG